MMAENQNTINVPALFHSILFAYQKNLKAVLGSGEAIFVEPVLKTMEKLDKDKGINSLKGKSIDETLVNFAKDLVASQAVTKASFEKVGEVDYTFCVDGCIFANHVHDLLAPKDVVCPLALVAMSIYQSVTNVKVKLIESEFTSDGSRTLITSYKANSV